MATYSLTVPLGEEAVRRLRLGDLVYLSGRVYTARDMAHLRVRKLRSEGEPLPSELGREGSALFHAGPVAVRSGDGWALSVIGPTTSMRMEPHADFLPLLGVRAVIGKGGMGRVTRKVLKDWGAVYLAAAPGCAVKHASCITAVYGVHWLDLGMPEAVWVYDVDSWGPLIVAMDSTGASVYDRVAARAKRVERRLLSRWLAQ